MYAASFTFTEGKSIHKKNLNRTGKVGSHNVSLRAGQFTFLWQI